MSNLIRDARIFMIAAHEAVQQKRKYTGEPYWKHPQSVAMIVSGVKFRTEEMIAAAMLHDVIEDTGVKIETICEMFGETVANLVEGLTDQSKPEDGNRAKRKAIDREHIGKQSSQCKTIKLADLIHNTESILAYDKEFAKVYVPEKELLLEVLKYGDRYLWEQANLIVKQAKRELGLEQT